MKKNIKFEEAIEQLDNYVRSLESGNLSLDESIEAYAEAVKLVKVCNERLDSADQKVRILTESPDGSISDRPFDKEDED